MSFDPQEAAGQEAEKADGKKSKVASIKPVTRAEWENKISKYLEGLGFTRISDTQILNKDGQFLRVLPTGQVVPLYRVLAEPGRITKFVVETSEGYDKKQHLTAGVIFDPRDRFVSGLTSDVNDQTLIKNKDQIAKARTIPAQLILAGFREEVPNSKVFTRKMKHQYVYSDGDGARDVTFILTSPTKVSQLLEPVKDPKNLLKGAFPDSISKGFEDKELLFIQKKMDGSYVYTSSISDSVRGIGLNREYTEKELNLSKIQKKTQDGGFIIGGANSTSVIQGLKSINGIPIDSLEGSMRPRQLSDSGFLGENESLKAVLGEDNNTVSKLGLSHEKIARPLFVTREIARRVQVDAGNLGGFVFEGKPYHYEITTHRGIQVSPFNDGTGTDSDIVVRNPRTGKTLNFSGLMPDMIARYGFYEGHGTRYRVDPKDIADLFELVKK